MTFGFLFGGLVGASLVSRDQWLHPAHAWWRLLIVAFAAAAMVMVFRRERARAVLPSALIAALVSLWGIYGMARISETTTATAGTIAADLAVLAALTIPATFGAVLGTSKIRSRLR